MPVTTLSFTPDEGTLVAGSADYAYEFMPNK